MLGVCGHMHLCVNVTRKIDDSLPKYNAIIIQKYVSLC